MSEFHPVNIQNIIDKHPKYHEIYHGHKKDRYALNHIENSGNYYNYDSGNPHREDLRKMVDLSSSALSKEEKRDKLLEKRLQKLEKLETKEKKSKVLKELKKKTKKKQPAKKKKPVKKKGVETRKDIRNKKMNNLEKGISPEVEQLKEKRKKRKTKKAK